MWPRSLRETSPDYWEDQVGRALTQVHEGLHVIEFGTPGERIEPYLFMRDWLENVQISRILLGFSVGLGSFDDPRWVRTNKDRAERELGLLERSIARTENPVGQRMLLAQRQGRRKLVRKWREEDALVRARLGSAQDMVDFMEWFDRPSRKRFDGDAWLDEEAQAALTQTTGSDNHRTE